MSLFNFFRGIFQQKDNRKYLNNINNEDSKSAILQSRSAINSYNDECKRIKEATKLAKEKNYEKAVEILYEIFDKCDVHLKLIPYLQKAGRIKDIEYVLKKYIDFSIENAKEVYILNKQQLSKSVELNNAYPKRPEKAKETNKKAQNIHKRKMQDAAFIAYRQISSGFDKVGLAYKREKEYKRSFYFYTLEYLFQIIGYDIFPDSFGIDQIKKAPINKIDKEIISNIESLLKPTVNKKDINILIASLATTNEQLSDILKIKKFSLESFMPINFK